MFLTVENIIVLTDVDSTNNYAKQLVGKSAKDGTVVLARFQSLGRGQVGNFWESEAEKNLLMSLILYPGYLDAGNQFCISKAVSLALAKWLAREVENVSIKWPNDIYVGNKKIAGMLIENTIKGRFLDSSVVGVGLNLNQEKFISNAPNPVSLKQLTGKNYQVEQVLKEIFVELGELLAKLKNGALNEIDEAYFSQLFGKEEWRRYRKDGNEFEARIIGIGKFGQLQLEQKNGEVSEFMFKEVEFII